METETEKKQFSIRPSADAHERLTLAASWRGQTLSAFVLGAAMREADAVISTRDRIELTQDDAAMVLDLLDNPPVPNEAMRRALKLHAETFGERGGEDV